jgi:hypothetical protein
MDTLAPLDLTNLHLNGCDDHHPVNVLLNALDVSRDKPTELLKGGLQIFAYKRFNGSTMWSKTRVGTCHIVKELVFAFDTMLRWGKAIKTHDMSVFADDATFYRMVVDAMVAMNAGADTDTGTIGAGAHIEDMYFELGAYYCETLDNGDAEKFGKRIHKLQTFFKDVYGDHPHIWLKANSCNTNV